MAQGIPISSIINLAEELAAAGGSPEVGKIYVSAASGNDTTGDGSSQNTYSSVALYNLGQW